MERREDIHRHGCSIAKQTILTTHPSGLQTRVSVELANFDALCVHSECTTKNKRPMWEGSPFLSRRGILGGVSAHGTPVLGRRSDAVNEGRLSQQCTPVMRRREVESPGGSPLPARRCEEESESDVDNSVISGWLKFRDNKRVWNDLKCRVRSKLVSLNASHQATGGGPSTAVSLTALEERIANILGRDVGPLPNVRQDPFFVQNETMNEETPEVVENIEEYIVGEELEPLSVVDLESGLQEGAVQDSAPQDVATHNSVETSPTQIETDPPMPGPSHDYRLRRQRQRQQRAAENVGAYIPPAQSNRTALEESRLLVLEMERKRMDAMLEIEKMRAEANLNISRGFQLIAESIDRFARQYAASRQEDDII